MGEWKIIYRLIDRFNIFWVNKRVLQYRLFILFIICVKLLYNIIRISSVVWVSPLMNFHFDHSLLNLICDSKRNWYKNTIFETVYWIRNYCIVHLEWNISLSILKLFTYHFTLWKWYVTYMDTDNMSIKLCQTYVVELHRT